jgi:hypothetical protein
MVVSATEPRGDAENGRSPLRTQRKQPFPNRFRISGPTFVLVLVLGLLFLYLSHRPLWHTDLWGHLAYGRLILSNRAVPQTEPFMPLSRGMKFIDLAWLSEVLGYAAFQWEGIAAIQFLYATSITTCLAVLAFVTARRTQIVGPALLAVFASTWLEWQQFLIVRPQLAGLACFTILLAVITRKELGKQCWIVVPLLLAVWANLHGSFIVGLALLATVAAGRGGDLLRRTATWRALWRDRTFRTLLTLIPVATLAVLLNPWGWTIFRDIWQTARNPNFAALVEWRPLSLQMRQGQAAAVVALALMVAYRLTPRRISLGEVLLLVGLGAATLQSSRMIVWWAPVASYFLAVHAAAIWKRFGRRWSIGKIGAKKKPASVAWTLGSVVTACGVAVCSPLGLALCNGTQADPRQSLSVNTPLGAIRHLNAHPPEGQIFNTYEWGDYLLWAGPKGLRVFVASHAHLIPSDVWQDYLRVITLRSGWEAILNRYGVTAAVLDSDQHGDLVDALRAGKDWTPVYEDDRSVIFIRRYGRGPIGG